MSVHLLRIRSGFKRTVTAEYLNLIGLHSDINEFVVRCKFSFALSVSADAICCILILVLLSIDLRDYTIRLGGPYIPTTANVFRPRRRTIRRGRNRCRLFNRRSLLVGYEHRYRNPLSVSGHISGTDKEFTRGCASRT